MKRSKIFLLLVFLFVACSGFAYSQLRGVTILLDPGHGGADPGAVGPTGLKESETNLRVARYLRQLLEADGAVVYMTRETDSYISLKERVQLADKIKPDLFVSIHHNASLKPRKVNRAEIYFNALDSGTSRLAGQKMIKELEAYGFGNETLIVPGGFFVLRNNPAPAVLTEGSYISIPDIEQQLKTGKALTDQAQALRVAIRDTFANGPLNIKLFVSQMPVFINTPFFNFIFAANKPVKQIKARLSGAELNEFGFDLLPPIGNTYRFYNRKALKSGQYVLHLTFCGEDGSLAPRKVVPLSVELPFENCSIKPAAPYIPLGFKGRFPIEITMRDTDGQLNARSVPVALFFGNNGESIGTTNLSAKTTMLIDLNGKERESLEVRLVHDSEILATTNIPIKAPDAHYVLGRITDENDKGIAGVHINYGLKPCYSIDKGYFFLEYPMIFNNLQLDLTPPPGYKSARHWLRTRGEPAIFANIILKKIAPSLMGKKVGFIAAENFNNQLFGIFNDLHEAGAKPVRLSLPANMAKPEYQAVLEANLSNDFALLLSIKEEAGKAIVARHYHRGGRGKEIAKKLADSLQIANFPLELQVVPGSDYEISHTGATSIVFAFPRNISPEVSEEFFEHLVKVLKSVF
jgi:N-acetylmuramoyl-L-alanine amidase